MQIELIIHAMNAFLTNQPDAFKHVIVKHERKYVLHREIGFMTATLFRILRHSWRKKIKLYGYNRAL